jgi:hypothetical protein
VIGECQEGQENQHGTIVDSSELGKETEGHLGTLIDILVHR